MIEIKNIFLFVLLFAYAPLDYTAVQDVVSPVPDEEIQEWKSMVVTASAYNSLKGQGQGNPSITAWGDTLQPGMKSIAVSADLLKEGLTYGTPVQIKGLEGIYIVNDKMHPRWRNKIDIYMGVDREKALEWGRRKVEICFPFETASQ